MSIRDRLTEDLTRHLMPGYQVYFDHLSKVVDRTRTLELAEATP